MLLLAGVSLFAQQRYVEVKRGESTIAVIDLERVAAITIDYGTLYIWLSGTEHLSLSYNDTPNEIMVHLEKLLNAYNEAKKK